MWPEDLETWLIRFRVGPRWIGADHQRTDGQLHYYPPLRDCSYRIAREAAEQARRIARGNPITYDNLFDEKQFRRWLFRTTEREALRLVLDREPVLSALAAVAARSEQQRQLLLWRYVLPLTDLDVAALLSLKDRYSRPDAAAAQQLCREAYRALCRELKSAMPEEAARVSSIFPMYPGQ